MPSPAPKIRAALKLLSVLIIILVITIAMVLFSGQERRVAHLPDGSTIRLEGYAFQSNNVRYEFPNRRIIGGFAKVLPAWAKNKVKWLTPEVTSVVSPSFPREPVLSAAFSLRDSSGKSARAGTRMAVSDDRGQLFDSAVNYLGNQGVFKAKGFPRRGKELRLRLMEDDKLLAEFNIPNPCPGPHPRWTAQSMPMTVTNAGLEITLEKFEVDGARLKTQCVFLVREDGSESAEWLPVAFEVSDATGNHWRPAADPPLKAASGNQVTGCFLGALWQDEDAWEIRVEFKRVTKNLNSNAIATAEFLARPEQVRHDSE